MKDKWFEMLKITLRGRYWFEKRFDVSYVENNAVFKQGQNLQDTKRGENFAGSVWTRSEDRAKWYELLKFAQKWGDNRSGYNIVTRLFYLGDSVTCDDGVKVWAKSSHRHLWNEAQLSAANMTHTQSQKPFKEVFECGTKVTCEDGLDVWKSG